LLRTVAQAQMKLWQTLMLGKSFAHYSDNYAEKTYRCSIALVAPFAGLRQFADGRGFQQWTGDDSKALMKVQWFIYSHGMCQH
jgi:hypothetical protein